MLHVPNGPTRLPSIVRRLALAACVLAAAAAVAAGCGGDSTGGKADTETAGALRWLPADTWLVATADVSSARLDRAVDTLGRLAAWGLVEPVLPASDGTGLRRAALEQVAKELSSGKAEVSAKQLEEAFGNRVGLAITSANDLANLADSDEMPIAAWVELDDESKARDLLERVVPGKETESEHEGVTYYESEDEEMTYALQDDLLVATTSPKNMERLIDARKGDESKTLAGGGDARAVLGATVDQALGGVAVQTDPLLAAAGDALRDESDPAAKRFAAAVETDAVDDLVPDWLGGSAAIDESGLRMRATWSNPRELADPDEDARTLVERLSADTAVASATASSGDELARIQSSWSQVRDAADLDLEALVEQECPKAQTQLCDLGVQLALTVLEDESLADAVSDAGPMVGAMASYASAAKDPTAAKVEFASTHAALDWERPKALTDAMLAAGLDVRTTESSATLRVKPASPLGAVLRKATAEPAAVRALRSAYGIDIARLLTPAGLRIEATRADDFDVVTLPLGAASKAAPAITEGTDVLADDQDYRDAVEAARPPEAVGSFGYVDVRAWAGSLIDLFAAGDPGAARAKPIVDNNLADLPGIVWWTTRERSGGESVGVAELAVPIRE